VEAVVLPHGTIRGTKSYNARLEVPSEAVPNFHYGILYADVFPVGSAGDTAHLVMQDMLGHFLPPYLTEALPYSTARRRTDILVAAGVHLPGSMYNVTSAVIQALRAALLFRSGRSRS